MSQSIYWTEYYIVVTTWRDGAVCTAHARRSREARHSEHCVLAPEPAAEGAGGDYSSRVRRSRARACCVRVESVRARALDPPPRELRS
ncbi:hypothetical protein KGM_209908 [Danaus plexippus plexippus]|uniref:Uncharacterized protein n=1 Tax=Danaus plexippus plexippus TaxID=278856 RepID=A0A212EK05_DANPL|nr:hypothetical protein KGM_209908 [Danaus plexippus plexippus]